MFERFTTSARDVVVSAQAQARRWDHPAVGASHLLLALAGSDGPAGDLLRARGVGARVAGRALELSLREAIRVKDRQIGEEHVLLGVLRGGDVVAAGMLAVLGVDPADLRRAVEERRRRSA